MAARAFKTSCCGIDCIVFADSASKARYTTFLSANDAGWNVCFADIRVIRAPEFDQGVLYGGGIVEDMVCYGIDYLEPVASIAI